MKRSTFNVQPLANASAGSVLELARARFIVRTNLRPIVCLGGARCNSISRSILRREDIGAGRGKVATGSKGIL